MEYDITEWVPILPAKFGYDIVYTSTAVHGRVVLLFFLLSLLYIRRSSRSR
jgi:hypothetical protein